MGVEISGSGATSGSPSSLKEEVVNHAGSVAITESDLNKVHVFSGAATITLVEITTGMIGKWIKIKKRTSEAITINIAGSDVIIDQASFVNSTSEDWAYAHLNIEALAKWGVEYLGTWV